VKERKKAQAEVGGETCQEIEISQNGTATAAVIGRKPTHSKKIK
jgi:hypothetical protein